MPPRIDPTLCIGCGTCSAICNSDIFEFRSGAMSRPEVRYPDECWHCNACVLDCPARAITLRIPLTYLLLRRNAPATRQEGSHEHHA